LATKIQEGHAAYLYALQKPSRTVNVGSHKDHILSHKPQQEHPNK
jgi:hypothetical protein